MSENKFNMEGIDIAWCPGCGNFGILKVLKKVLGSLGLDPEDIVLVSGIGQAAKIPQYLRCNYFNGLHGRALPPATAIKAVNSSLTVIAESGDGDMYGEGGNHFIHAIRRNPDITNIVHNNMIYGLTKGQASPTSRTGMKTPVQVAGVILEPFNPLAVAIALDAGFVARCYIGDGEKTEEILREAISFNGYALVDLLQPCVTFNRINTYSWFKENTYYLDDSHNPENRSAAFEKAIETEKLPLGVFYRNGDRKPFEINTGIYGETETPLFQREADYEKIEKLIRGYALS